MKKSMIGKGFKKRILLSSENDLDALRYEQLEIEEPEDEGSSAKEHAQDILDNEGKEEEYTNDKELSEVDTVILSENSNEDKKEKHLETGKENIEKKETEEELFIGNTFLDNSSVSSQIKAGIEEYDRKVKEMEKKYETPRKRKKGKDVPAQKREVEDVNEEQVKKAALVSADGEVKAEKKCHPLVREKNLSSGKESLTKSNEEKNSFPKLQNSGGQIWSKCKKMVSKIHKNKGRHTYLKKEGTQPVFFAKTMWYVAPVALLILVGGIYIYRLSTAPLLSEKNITSSVAKPDKEVYQYGPLHPYEMCSMRKPDLIAQLGDPMGEGEGVDDETKYLRYEYEWFGLPTKSKIYYGREQRIYKAVINFPTVEFDELQQKITDGIGKPISVEENEEYKDVIWMRDSIKYWLTKTDDGKNQLEVRLAYYGNPNDYELGYRPTIVQRIKDVDINGDNMEDDVVLIGSKTSYTETKYDKLFLIFISEKETRMKEFPDDMNGGLYPQMEITNDKKIVVTANNSYMLNKNVFAFEDGKITNIESINAPLKK